MVVITQDEFGGPEVLRAVTVERPRPGPGEVVVRVAATSVNPADWKVRAGRVNPPWELPFTLGFDVSGVVAEVGADVGEFRGGEPVFGLVFGRYGANAEYVTVPAGVLARIPAGASHLEAAVLPTAGLTAWQSLSAVRAGQRVLIHAAAGGVGHLGVQLAVARGAYVIGTASAKHHDYLRKLGAHELIDYTTTDFTESLTEVDRVLDLVGGDYGKRSLRVLRPDGVLIAALDSDAEGDPRCHRLHVQPSAADLSALAAEFEAGRLGPTLAAVYPLTDLAAAHRHSESGGVRGKIAIEVDPSLTTG